VETIEYSKRTPGIRYSDEEEVLLSTPTGAARPVGSGPCHTTCHTCASFDVNAVCWSNLGRASKCRKRKQLVDGRKRGKTPVVPRACLRAYTISAARTLERISPPRACPVARCLRMRSTRSRRSPAAPMRTQSRREEALMRHDHCLVVDAHSFSSVPLPHELDQTRRRRPPHHQPRPFAALQHRPMNGHCAKERAKQASNGSVRP
jgi:hypothetical protein